MFNLDYLFCDVDDFCQQFEPQWQQKLLSHGAVSRIRAKSLCLSEIMTILIAFHLSWCAFPCVFRRRGVAPQNDYRNFKHFYLNHVQQYWNSAFPKLPSYQSFVQWIPSTIILLCVYLKHCFGSCIGISFIDSTKIQVCHNRRVSRHKVFQDLAQRGKTSVDWFFGFKLHHSLKVQDFLDSMSASSFSNIILYFTTGLLNS